LVRRSLAILSFGQLATDRPDHFLWENPKLRIANTRPWDACGTKPGIPKQWLIGIGRDAAGLSQARRKVGGGLCRDALPQQQHQDLGS